MKGKLIVIEGTDCSGKETQTKALVNFLKQKGHKVKRFSFPMYDTPTGKIVGGPYLGKSYICEGWFPEKAPQVDPKVSSLYYAADRLYNIHIIKEELDKGVNVILDRYTFSNMAHQGGKISDPLIRNEMYEWISTLEFEFLGLPMPDIALFIHMPYEGACILKENREEGMDQNEADEKHLRNAEEAFIEVASKYNFKFIECIKEDAKMITKDSIKRIEDISEEISSYVEEELNKKDIKEKTI